MMHFRGAIQAKAGAHVAQAEECSR